MKLFDLHAHHRCFGIENIDYPDTQFPESYSVGIHPWHITSENKEGYINYVTEHSKDNKCVAIGECGLDKLCKTDYTLQYEAFLKMISISETLEKPLIIHCVKAFAEIIHLHKTLKPMQKWIIHGFRGKPQLAHSLTAQGIYLSFGEKYNEQSLSETPSEYIFIETDESDISIEHLYEKAASLKHLSIHEFLISTAYKRVF